MPQSIGTLTSITSSLDEFHQALNSPEQPQFVDVGSERHQTSNVTVEEHNQTIHTSHPASISTDLSALHNELHPTLDESSEGQVSSTESGEKPVLDTGSGERQPCSEELEGKPMLDLGSEKHEDASRETPAVPQPKMEVDCGASAPTFENKEDEYAKGIKLYLVLAALTIVYFLIMLDNTIIATAIPYITDEFHSLLDVGWYGSAYQLSCAALQPLGGKVYSRLNSKWSFITYLVLFEIGSLICGAARSSIMLILGRAIAGIGGSGLLNGALIILNSCIPPHRQPAHVGIMMGIGQLGIAFGPLIGGAFTEYVTWRWCFYINLPIGGVVALTVACIPIPDHIAKPSIREVFNRAIVDFDLPGFALFAPAAIQFFLALQYGGNQYAWGSSQVIGLFCGAGATFIVWLVWNYYQGDNAMVPCSMMKNRIVWASCAAGLFLGGTVFITAYYLPIYFQAVLAYSPFMSGVNVLPNLLSQMVFGIITGGLMQRIGYYTPFILLGATLNAVGCGLLSLLTPHSSSGPWIGFQILMGTGRGLSMAVPFLAVQNNLSKDLIPAAMSTLVFMQNFGAAVMVILSQTILTNSLIALVPQDAPGVDPQVVVGAGTTTSALEQAVGSTHFPGVLWAYSHSLQRIWYFAAAIGGLSFLISSCLGWEKIRKRADELDSNESSQGLSA
ncbi:major facilitator superfamily domain-containing protein [Hypoxylon sp. FL0543]|nr:major facilitator superfamily domain-containing protein [Hypoxylon sp. FL0543]